MEKTCMLETKNRYPVTIILLLLIFILLTPINSGCKKKEVKAPPEKMINIQVLPAEKRSLRPFIETIGSLNPYEEVVVSAEVDGTLKNVKVDEGSVVSKGEVIATIDDTDYSLEVKRAEASLRQAESTLSNTQLEYKRKEPLYKEELVTKQQFDDVSTRLSLAEADVDRAKASLALAKQRLSKTGIISPLSGVVKEKKIERGNYVKNGTPLFTIIQTNPLKLNFTVTEKDVGKLKLGQDVLLRVDALPEKEFQGKLSIIYPSLDEKTRTLQIEAQIPNTKGLLKPGLFAHIMLYTGSERDTIIVPITALLYEADKIKIFIIEGDRAKERPVRIGQKYRLQSGVGSQESGVKEYTEIIEGVKAGEQVVIVGQQNLFEGAKVNVAR
jgi:RND family efflux transporter MFP subunit